MEEHTHLGENVPFIFSASKAQADVAYHAIIRWMSEWQPFEVIYTLVHVCNLIGWCMVRTYQSS